MCERSVAPSGGPPEQLCDPRPFVAFLFAAAVLLAVFSPGVRADDDLPGRVGRIADAAGQLFVSPEDRATEWAPIGVNYSVTSGDNLWVSVDGRAEVDYGGGQFRFSGETSLHVSRLDDRQLALFVAQGRLIVRLRVLEPGDVAAIDAPNAQIRLTRAGLYRIEVAPDRQTTLVTVREGEALVVLASSTQQVLPGQTAMASGGDPAAADVRNSGGVDDFDAWSASRDRHYERSGATAYVSRQMLGYADLDGYGSWQTYPDYGPVWFPSAVGSDWAPYSDGYWTNVGAWGFTWVDFAPWGYAPTHYGRWAHVGGRWGWCPGAVIVARPVWAPALVAWHGGPRWGLASGDGSPIYGWIPLGWRDPYLPPWRGCSTNCWARFNEPYGVNVRERPRGPPATYANMRVPGAITAVPRATLVGAQPVALARVKVPAQLASSAPVLGAAPPVSPGRAYQASTGPAFGAPAAASAHIRNPGSRAAETAPAVRATALPGVALPIGGTNQVTSSGAAVAAPALPRSQPPSTAYPARPSAAPAPPLRAQAPILPTPDGNRAAEVTPPLRVESRPVPQRVPVYPQSQNPAASTGSGAQVPTRVERNSAAPAAPPSLYAAPAPVPATVPMRAPAVVVSPQAVPAPAGQPAQVSAGHPATRPAGSSREAPQGSGQNAAPAGAAPGAGVR